MSIIEKMVSGIAGALAGLPQTNPQNHALISTSFANALGAPVQESVDALQAQIDALNAQMAAMAAANADALNRLGTRISNIPIYTPPSCLSYRITNRATDSTPDTDVVYTYKGCDGVVSARITLFAGNFDKVCANGAPTIVLGGANAQVDSLGTGNCVQPNAVATGTPTPLPQVTPTPEVTTKDTNPSATPTPLPDVTPSTPFNNRSRPGSSPIPPPTPIASGIQRSRPRP